MCARRGPCSSADVRCAPALRVASLLDRIGHRRLALHTFASCFPGAPSLSCVLFFPACTHAHSRLYPHSRSSYARIHVLPLFVSCLSLISFSPCTSLSIAGPLLPVPAAVYLLPLLLYPDPRRLLPTLFGGRTGLFLGLGHALPSLSLTVSYTRARTRTPGRALRAVGIYTYTSIYQGTLSVVPAPRTHPLSSYPSPLAWTLVLLRPVPSCPHLPAALQL